YDLRFRLYDAALGGNQIGSTLCSDNISVADGLFTASLDFGPQFTGQQRFLEIEVRADTGLNCANAAGFTILGPRQPLTAAPNAVFALNAGQLNGQSPSYYLNASNLGSGTVPSARLSGSYSGITGVGVLSAGTWQAAALDAAHGGTGLTPFSLGDLIYAAAPNTLTRLP